jgi:hypothetical protein
MTGGVSKVLVDNDCRDGHAHAKEGVLVRNIDCPTAPFSKSV